LKIKIKLNGRAYIIILRHPEFDQEFTQSFPEKFFP